jgi:hypothetical protein
MMPDSPSLRSCLPRVPELRRKGGGVICEEREREGELTRRVRAAEVDDSIRGDGDGDGERARNPERKDGGGIT